MGSTFIIITNSLIYDSPHDKTPRKLYYFLLLGNSIVKQKVKVTYK